MKFILWPAISIVWLLGQYAFAQAPEQTNESGGGFCQSFIAQAWRYGDARDNNAANNDPSSQQALLKGQIQAICLINEVQPRTDEGAIASDEQPSPETFTIPSLWWPQIQVGDAINERLIDSWRAYDNSGNTDQSREIPSNNASHVDVVVNGQLWPSLNYLERYSLMNQLGQSAKDYRYQLRIFIGNRPVGLQVCDFDGDIVSPIPLESPTVPDEVVLTPVCAVVLNYFDPGAIRGSRQR
ncbi:hypothetical protein [Leptolyngbya sp. Heron Island J]|uniref:hypothetical protein n=1 Tax=Leptolyngbya sp. Heron Island J TaxID=1385935 RepID=UPI0004CF96E1|nr:hypothetical protein [Leptolyngbya sp. Heron Island J]